jgi:hypothetical protein
MTKEVLRLVSGDRSDMRDERVGERVEELS